MKLEITETDTTNNTAIDTLIAEEASKDIAGEANFDTAEFNQEIMHDYRHRQYRFLRWVDESFSPSTVLYAGSGFDVIPKIAFGEEKVVHTSLEDHRGDKRYFPDLGIGHKVVADNSMLPFRDSVFDTILHFELPFLQFADHFQELDRVLRTGGLILFTQTVLSSEKSELELGSFFHARTDYKKLSVPQDLATSNGASEAKFFMYQKL